MLRRRAVIFHYGPPLWRLGITEHYDEFEAGGDRRKRAAEAIVASTPTIAISTDTSFFRIRINVKADEHIATAATFDPPPASIQREPGRWDTAGFPVLYVSDDIELCLHECRATISDEIVVATLRPVQGLRLLDLSAEIACSSGTPFEDPNIFVGIMCRSRGRWLDYCRTVAQSAQEAGFDGIRYNSYYAQAKHASNSLNLAIFGRPLEAGVLEIDSINRLRISDMSYQFAFGPVLYRDSSMTAEIVAMIARLKKDEAELAELVEYLFGEKWETLKRRMQDMDD